ncbi:Conserved hypothetical protein CHP02001 [uncultured Caudovirales phage]|uniref:Uncharacterized protein n=1 Tax=uncultured Caudovirales phage TaxID=2100421 RepID=A0A6J7WPK7_9CAUD|nr:Conserved hypothetical protein CHP02001 [uncultured Caudovirales phage]
MKKLLLALLMAAGVSVAQAQVTGNLGLTSDYRFRGISQTQNGPAVQGGIDYAHSSGLYIGNWNSSVSSQLYTNGAGVESDLYAGWKKDIYKGLTVDVGSYNYFYPNATNGSSPNFNTQELFAGLGYGPVAVKFSQSTSNYFGLQNSTGTQYYQADVNQSFAPLSAKLKDLSFVAHYGHTAVANHSNLDYNDINVGLTYNLDGWMLAAKYYTNTALTSTGQRANTLNGQQLYKDAGVFSVTKSFN